MLAALKMLVDLNHMDHLLFAHIWF